MRSAIILFFSLVISISDAAIPSDWIDIGVLGPSSPKVIQVIPEYGSYAVIADGENKATLRPGERISLTILNNRIEIAFSTNRIGSYRDVRLMSLTEEGFFRLYVLKGKREERVYDDHLIVKPRKSNLLIINRVQLEKYVAGVVEAETGKEKTIEFYKVQAIISRTYALSNRRKHLAKGYNLSDQVDSQVYHGKCRWEPLILDAVNQTQGEVLVDSEMRLITAAFHSNSGGETISSDVVWSGALPYLSPRLDGFSKSGDHYCWEITVATSDWLNYLKETFDLRVDNPAVKEYVTEFEQERRKIYLGDPSFDIPLTQVRKDRGLNSTFFSIHNQVDSVKFVGKGFGHGIGLSQEGAMRMSELGFNSVDILHFYYNDIHLIDLRALEFFLEE